VTSPSKLARDRKRSAAHHRRIEKAKSTPAVLRAGALEGYAAANDLRCFKCNSSDGHWATIGIVAKTGFKWALCQSCADANRQKKKTSG